VTEELKDPSKRTSRSKEKDSSAAEAERALIDESDYVPAKQNMTVLVGGGEDESANIDLKQREVILKEIAAFRDRSNRRERNKTWFEELEKDKEKERERDEGRRDGTPDRREDRRRRGASPGGGEGGIPSGPAAERRRGYVKFRPEMDRYEREDDDNVPDEELENRRLARKTRDLEQLFIEVNIPFLNSLFLWMNANYSASENGCHARNCEHQPSREK
jgi:hypothetical protein